MSNLIVFHSYFLYYIMYEFLPKMYCFDLVIMVQASLWVLLLFISYNKFESFKMLQTYLTLFILPCINYHQHPMSLWHKQHKCHMYILTFTYKPPPYFFNYSLYYPWPLYLLTLPMGELILAQLMGLVGAHWLPWDCHTQNYYDIGEPVSLHISDKRLRLTIDDHSWQRIRCNFLQHFHKPSLDLLAWILVKKLMPTYYRKLDQQVHNMGWFCELPSWQKHSNLNERM